MGLFLQFCLFVFSCLTVFRIEEGYWLFLSCHFVESVDQFYAFPGGIFFRSLVYGGKTNWCSHRIISVAVPKITRNRPYHMTQPHHSRAYAQRTLFPITETSYSSLPSSALFTVSRAREQPRCPWSDERMMKMCYLDNRTVVSYKEK